MTPQQIEQAARRRLNALTSKFWSPDEIISDHLYFASMEMALRTRSIQKTYTTVSVANQNEYTKPSTTIETRAVYYDGRKLEVIDERQFDSLKTTFDTPPTGIPQNYFLWGDTYTLFPTPAEDGKAILIRSIDEPSVPTATSLIELPSWMHWKLVDGVAFYMISKEAGDPRINDFRAIWEANLDWAEHEVVRRKRADKFTRVKREEDLLQNPTGIL